MPAETYRDQPHLGRRTVVEHFLQRSLSRLTANFLEPSFQRFGSAVELLIVSHINPMPILRAAVWSITLAIGMAGPAICADQTGEQSVFEEHRVEFYNQDSLASC